MTGPLALFYSWGFAFVFRANGLVVCLAQANGLGSIAGRNCRANGLAVYAVRALGAGLSTSPKPRPKVSQC